jgi:YD repeat-containing protein
LLQSTSGAATTYTYAQIQGQAKLAQVAQTGVTNTTNTLVAYSYDSYGHPTSFIDARGVTTTFQYSSDGLLLDRVAGNDPNNTGQQRETRYTWDSLYNQLTNVQILGPGGVTISRVAYTYYPVGDAARNRVQAVYVTNQSANGVYNQTQTTSYSYQFYPSGTLSQIVANGPSGAITKNYDSVGNLIRVTDPAGNQTTYNGYNGLGLPASVIDPNGYTVNYSYDSRGRVRSISRTLDGVSATTMLGYNGLGQLSSVNYPDGGALVYAYDGAGRLVNKSGDVRTIVDPEFNSTTYTQEEYVRNSLGAVTAVTGKSYNKNCVSIDGGPSTVPIPAPRYTADMRRSTQLVGFSMIAVITGRISSTLTTLMEMSQR